MRFTKILAISLGILSLMGCVKQHHRQKNVTIHQYKHHVNNDSIDAWIYWYIIYSNNNVYYYSSSTAVSNFSNVTFGKSATLPEEVQKELDSSEQLPDEVVEPDMQPVEVAEEVNMDTTDAQDHDMTNEGGPDYNSSESDTSSVDTGGSDSGGGGDF